MVGLEGDRGIDEASGDELDGFSSSTPVDNSVSAPVSPSTPEPLDSSTTEDLDSSSAGDRDASPVSLLDPSSVYVIVHKVVSRMAPPVLGPRVVGELVSTLTREILLELGTASAEVD